ncbi:MAG TPA: hypothetical protein DDY49_03490 [Paenibacillaceae bacterium]|nr:hypothetical protein [Paenibacillaceae bacterium]
MSYEMETRLQIFQEYKEQMNRLKKQMKDIKKSDFKNITKYLEQAEIIEKELHNKLKLMNNEEGLILDEENDFPVEE